MRIFYGHVLQHIENINTYVHITDQHNTNIMYVHLYKRSYFFYKNSYKPDPHKWRINLYNNKTISGKFFSMECSFTADDSMINAREKVNTTYFTMSLVNNDKTT